MSMDIREIKEKLEKASDDYYNGKESMSNYEYDELEKKFTDMGGVLKVGSEVRGKLSKISHEFPAKSLDKSKDIMEIKNRYERIIGSDNTEEVVSWKLDGLTVQLTYLNGKIVSAATRGDGYTGQDILKNIKYFTGIPESIPYDGKLVVRGEATMSYNEFDRINSLLEDTEKYANPRNLASATVTLVDETDLKNREINFRAFELVHQDIYFSNMFCDRLKFLKACGFEVVPYEVYTLRDMERVIEEWSKDSCIRGFGTPVDGLVIVHNDCDFSNRFEGTEHHPHFLKGIAFKWKDETVETVIRDIEWSPSRTGLLNPVAVFDTVDLEGTKVSRASLHNFSIMRKFHIRVGDRVEVYKANKIIPQIAKNLSEDKTTNYYYEYRDVKCPVCGSEAEVFSRDGVETVYCMNPDCEAKRISKLSHFCSKACMNIEGISDSILERLYNENIIKDFDDIYRIDRYKDMISTMEGFGEKSYSNMWKSIQESRSTTFHQVINAMGVSGIGSKQSSMLEKEFKSDIHRFLKACESGFDFSVIEGFGEVTAHSILTWYQRDGLQLIKVLPYLDIKVKSMESDRLDGKTFVITGSLSTYANRDELVKTIELHGGRVSGSVSSKTSYLINNDIESTSGKNKKAKELGVRIITEEMFNTMICNKEGE